MALANGPFVGNEILFGIDVSGATSYVTANCQRDFSIDIQSETIDASCKGTGKWGNRLDGTKDTTISLSALFEIGGAASDAVFFDAIVNSTRFTYQASTGVEGDFKYEGMAILTGFTMNFPFNDVGSFDVTAGGLGEITRGTVPAP